VTTEFLDEFASEQDGPARVSEILARGVPIRWDEAVALLQEVLETITAGGGEHAPIPAFEDVLLDGEGAVRVTTARRGERGPVAAGRALHTLLATADIPLPLRLFVTQANAPETHASLQSFADGLAYFGKPGRGELIRAIYERYRSTAPAALDAPSAPGRPATPPPLPRHDARGDQMPGPRRTAPQWLMPAAVVVCVASLAAVLWFGVLGGDSSAATSAAEAKDATAEAPTTKDASASQTAAKRQSAKTTGEREPASSTRARSQSTPGAPRGAVARNSSAPLFDPSTLRATEPLGLAQTPDAVPFVPASREYVIAPRENAAATSTIYSAADADVQPPVMMFPSLPPTVFVARNADVTVVNRMELVIAPDGSVERVRLVNGPTRMPDMMLLSGAKLWKFTPAVRDGVPVRYRTTVTWSGFP
jgi:hypothetical protein